MRLSFLTVRVTAVALTCVAEPLLAQDLTAIPPLQTQGAASFTCGGIGSYTVEGQAMSKTKSQSVTIGGVPKAIDFSF